MKKSKQKLFVVFSLLSLMMLGACNTIHGAGQDISKGGQAIERGSDNAGATPSQ